MPKKFSFNQSQCLKCSKILILTKFCRQMAHTAVTATVKPVNPTPKSENPKIPAVKVAPTRT